MTPFLGQIIMFGGNFPIRSFAFADGQLLPISQYSALFSLYGTIYGGDGRTTFALPDLRGRVAIHNGNGPGLSDYRIGSKGGRETITLAIANIPSHHHGVDIPVHAAAGNEDETNPAGGVLTNNTSQDTYTSEASDDTYQPFNSQNAGGSQAFDNRVPWLTITYQAALQGVFPSRN